MITAIHTGMRRGEIFNLRWKEVDLVNRVITVMDSKNREPRRIPMNKILTDLFAEISINAQSDLAFPGKDGKKLKSIRGPWERASKNSGIDDLHFHDLRHTFAARLVRSGVHSVTVKELLGHKSIEMTLRYSHLSQEHKQKAVEKLTEYSHPMDTEKKQKIIEFPKPA